MTKLNRANLASLRSGIAVPNYQASDLKPGILHFGLGNFHRAHQAVYLDTLFNMGKSRDWGIIGTGVRPADRAMHDARAEVQAAVDAATAAPWPHAHAAFTDIQDIGAGRWA